MDKKFILIPRRVGIHWILFVVINCDNYSGKVTYSKLKGKDNISCILFMDSLGSKPPKNVLKSLKDMMFAFYFLKFKKEIGKRSL